MNYYILPQIVLPWEPIKTNILDFRKTKTASGTKLLAFFVIYSSYKAGCVI
ncbi:MAG: hypothetical protein IKQ94_10690 [Bacteroidales bacterium]|nr:hypothetical protein [Bacteroidales bacterium]